MSSTEQVNDNVDNNQEPQPKKQTPRERLAELKEKYKNKPIPARVSTKCKIPRMNAVRVLPSFESIMKKAENK